MKTVLITGASRGIGKDIALTFANNNYNVVINYNKSEKQAKELLNELINLGYNATIYKADISNVNEVNKMICDIIDNFKSIDVLINNAGICSRGLFVDESNETSQNIINVNLVGTINVIKSALPHMLKKGYGKIINISSIWGISGGACEATYSATKAGIIGLTKALAKEYGYNGICVNAICPGVIDTEMNNNLSNQEKLQLIEQIPAKRMGNVNEISQLALFLASKNGDYINGQTITIDGGFTL